MAGASRGGTTAHIHPSTILACIVRPRMADSERPASLRLVELLAPLSLVTDLGMGQPPEEAMSACLLATSLARRMGLGEAEVADVYFATLLKHLGCTATSHEEAGYLGGDEIAGRDLTRLTDFTRPGDRRRLMTNAGKGRGPAKRARMVMGMVGGIRWGPKVTKAICEVGATMARRLGMAPGVVDSLYQMFERWDGKGGPQRLRGEQILAPARYATFASQVMAFANRWGQQAAGPMVADRAGGWFDPGIAAAFEAHGLELLVDIGSADVFREVLEAEPEPRRTVGPVELVEVAAAFADMVDLKSPFHHGHSTAVAALAAEGARALGVPREEVDEVRVAGLLHDLGRVGVPAGVWLKPGELTETEWEMVRLHPYHTERILSRSPALAPLARIVGMHHERQDGSGYYRQARAASIPRVARLLAAADAYQAMTQERAFRPALSPEEAAARLGQEAKDGRLDPEAVGAVCDAAGTTVRPLRPWPAGLSDREVEVLRLMAAGHSNREIGRRLFISHRTAEHHVQNIYSKIGLSTRAGAAMFALEHDLIAVGRK
jgi:HD-GYP domain-containing protein (c-di-GMP phosphodiesterase class II)/DNA-binding CsgD family transcriptional regulator